MRDRLNELLASRGEVTAAMPVVALAVGGSSLSSFSSSSSSLPLVVSPDANATLPYGIPDSTKTGTLDGEEDMVVVKKARLEVDVGMQASVAIQAATVPQLGPLHFEVVDYSE